MKKVKVNLKLTLFLENQDDVLIHPVCSQYLLVRPIIGSPATSVPPFSSNLKNTANNSIKVYKLSYTNSQMPT